jgi:hypothetical protein
VELYPRLRRLLKIAAVLLPLVFLILPFFSTLQAEYYDRYPALRSRIENWRRSTHSPWSCAACHVEPGLGPSLSFAARSIPSFYNQLVFGPSKSNLLTPPTTRTCQECHTAYRTVSASGDLLIPHRAHVEVLKIDCVDCHRNLVHSSNSEGFNTPDMSRCMQRCHNGRKATDRCVKCHTQKQVPPNHKHGNWLVSHGKRTEEINCASCHGWAPRLCHACHNRRPRTHAGNWKKLHQFRARERGQGCLFCHKQTFCARCHDPLDFRQRG